MMNLFSAFDMGLFNPKTISMTSAMILLTSAQLVYKSSSSYKKLETTLAKGLEKFFYTLKPKNFSKASMSSIMAIISTILFFNFGSVYSYNFPLTSQTSTVVTLALATYTAFVVFQMTKSLKSMMIHFIPNGSPIGLAIFLFAIEVISNMIRPLTVTVRLVANILSGHLLMILLSKLVMVLPLMMPAYLVLNTVELAVAMIQSYIFATMLTLYYSEVH